MTDKLVNQLTELTSVDTANDKVPIQDASDATELKYVIPSNLVPDASATVKGKVELATDAETITGTDTARAITPANYKNAFDDTLPAVVNAATGKTTPVDADELGLVDSAASNVLKKLTWANLKATLKTYFDTLYPSLTSWDGYIDDTAETWTYASSDAPTFTFTISGDKTAKYYPGQRIKLTQTTVKYFIVTAVSYGAPNTTVTVYGGTNYTLANAAISANYHSLMKAPLGFPMDPTKWTVKVTDTTERSASVTGGVPNNIGSTNAQISIPIGVWDVDFSVSMSGDRTTAGTGDSIRAALSTANNTESDKELVAYASGYGSGVANTSDVMYGQAVRGKQLVLAAKTLYYLNGLMENSGTVYFRNTIGTMVIRAVCSYL